MSGRPHGGRVARKGWKVGGRVSGAEIMRAAENAGGETHLSHVVTRRRAHVFTVFIVILWVGGLVWV